MNYSKRKDICHVVNTVGTWLGFLILWVLLAVFFGCFHRLNIQLVIFTAVTIDLNGLISCSGLMLAVYKQVHASQNTEGISSESKTDIKIKIESCLTGMQ